MNISSGSISESELSDVNITHSSCDNDDDERSNSAHQRHPSAASSVPSSSPSSSPKKKKKRGQPSESETEFDEDNGELDPLARMLCTPTPGEEGEETSSSSPLKIPKIEEDKKVESDIAIPKPSKPSAPANKSPAVLSSPSPSPSPSPTKEADKEAERRAEMRSKREAEEEEVNATQQF